jgi:hypothetical protein
MVNCKTKIIYEAKKGREYAKYETINGLLLLYVVKI